MMITTAHAGASWFSTNEIKAAEISNLSAIGSSIAPSVLPDHDDEQFASKSQSTLPQNINTPRICRAVDQLSENGVSSTTTSSGTMKIRSRVRAFGRFTNGRLSREHGTSNYSCIVGPARKTCQTDLILELSSPSL
jgi:hypothetical protein